MLSNDILSVGRRPRSEVYQSNGRVRRRNHEVLVGKVHTDVLYPCTQAQGNRGWRKWPKWWQRERKSSSFKCKLAGYLRRGNAVHVDISLIDRMEEWASYLTHFERKIISKCQSWSRAFFY